MGPTEMHKKGSHVIRKCSFFLVFQFSANMFWGVIFQNRFSPKAVQPEASGVYKKSKDPSGGPRIICWWRDFPRMSKIIDFKITHYSARQNIGDAGSTSTQNTNPLHFVVSKRPGTPHGAKKYIFCSAENQFFFSFSICWPYRITCLTTVIDVGGQVVFLIGRPAQSAERKPPTVWSWVRAPRWVFWGCACRHAPEK